jgi:predicted signal transduction protein with EAL and GGDEF domain
VFAEMLQPLQLTVSVGMDHGVAIFPQDAEQADQLIRIADERLYHQKHANHSRTANGSSRTETPPAPEASAAPAPVRTAPTPERIAPAPQPISIEAKRAPEKTETTITAAASATSAAISADLSPVPSRSFSVQRKAERVSMVGTNAYAVLGDQGARRARVIDLGFGGVSMELDSPEDLPENLLAVLHVPILPPVRVNLKPVWKLPTGQGGFRVGCAFVS